MFQMHVFRRHEPIEGESSQEHVAMVFGDVAGRGNLPVRVHSECMTSEVFGSLKCDCRDQLDLAMKQVAAQGAGIILYLRQEGRGIGLVNKIRAYQLQSQGHDTVDANRLLGLPDDARTYELVPEMLRHFDVPSILLMSNNPDKAQQLRELGVAVNGTLPVIVRPNPHSEGYLQAKRDRMGHQWDEARADAS